jgi:hypothetical protein
MRAASRPRDRRASSGEGPGALEVVNRRAACAFSASRERAPRATQGTARGLAAGACDGVCTRAPAFQKLPEIADPC